MEAFSAADDEQFNVIKQAIDLCDYYILIIGTRYGTLNNKINVSFTEMEYEYAVSKGIPILVFALDESIKVSDDIKEDIEQEEKLKKCREKVPTDRTGKIWKTIDELTSSVLLSILNVIKTKHRPGWQRGVDFDEASLRREIMSLNSEKKELESLVISLKEKITGFEDSKNLDEILIQIDFYEENIFNQESKLKQKQIS